MKIVNLLRWISFLPLGLAISVLFNALFYFVFSFIGKILFYEWWQGIASLLAGLAAAHTQVFSSWFIAPKVTKLSKWIVIGFILVVGVTELVLPTTENSSRLWGVMPTLYGCFLATMSPDEINNITSV